MRPFSQRITLQEQLARSRKIQELNSLYAFGLPTDWLTHPSELLGEFPNQSELISASIQRADCFRLTDNRLVKWVHLQQRDYHNGHLCGGVGSAWDLLNDIAKRVFKEHEWAKGHLVFGPTTFHRGGGLILSKFSDDEIAQDCMTERLLLPPIESVGILESDGFSDEPYSWLAVVWYHIRWGIPAEIEEFVKQLDWESVAFAGNW